MTSILQQIEQARQKLLDLTLRNRLLNHRPSRRRTLRIVDELPREIYSILVLQGKAMHFLPRAEATTPSENGGEEPEQEYDAPADIWQLPDPDEELEDRYTDSALQTALEADALQKRLFTISSESQGFIEEQGYTVLYLALGFLEWFESPDAASPRRAPLILVPVSLEREGVRKAFKLAWNEEDVVENISLRAKLGELGVGLPEFVAPEATEGIVSYFEQVARAVAEKPRWKVTRDIVLDFFSFSKFVMYKDLDPKAWPEDDPLTAHGVLQQVLDPKDGDSTGEGFDPNKIDEVLDPTRLYHVMDADPSQIAAIEDVKAGQSLVIEGPPGTGKSQTITNMIAELMAAGKSVLFVSEKMAALEVVKDRLERVGLGAFCIEVHSRSANKRRFLEQIARSASLSFPPARDTEGQFRELVSLRDHLDQYAAALAVPLGTLGITPGQAFQNRERAAKHFASVARPLPTVPMESPSRWTPDEVETARRSLRDLVSAYRAIAPAPENPWRGCRATVLLPPDIDKVKGHLGKVRELAETIHQGVSRTTETVGAVPAGTLAELPDMIEAARFLASAPNIDPGILEQAGSVVGLDRTPLIEAVAFFQDLRAKAAARLTPGAREENASALLKDFRPRAYRFFRFLDGTYRALRRRIGLMYLTGKAPHNDVVIQDLEILEKIQSRTDELRSLNEQGRKVFGSGWQGSESDVEALRKFDAWLTRLQEALQNGSIRKTGFHAFPKETAAGVHQTLDSLTDAAAGLDRELKDLSALLNLDVTVLPERSWAATPFDGILAQVDTWRAATPTLARWTSYVAFRDAAGGTRAAPLVAALSQSTLPPEDLLPTFEGNLADGILRDAFSERGELAKFSPDIQEDRVKRFSDLDRLLINKNQQRLAAKLSESRPRLSGGASPSSETGILLGQINRKRGHMPIRQLLSRCGNAVRGITPCFMMSPLSVAQFLDPRGSGFDVVIFDEASQVRPEEALGAMIRARQAIVIGDTQQLPPTSFFDHMVEDEEPSEDNATGVGEVESILHQCRRVFGARQLTWHYRSRHESLVAVSNREFYNNTLRIFPAAKDRDGSLGLTLTLLPDSVYDRGRSAANRMEARAVAETVIHHYQTSPDVSLGVGTFSSAQQRVIQQEIEASRQEHPELDEFFGRGHDEPFFVKNLETIQGDERDVILVSVGYGFDENRRLNRNFGPVNLEGGERRLNVLFTRARSRCEVFSNFGAEHLPVDPGSPRGVHVLKMFLDYANTGVLPEDRTSRADSDSPFEDSVADALRSHGYEVVNQVGCAGFRIDLGVRDPLAHGRYLIGIECDGSKYHSSPVARDRDRLRQQVLEMRGWRIHRIWSTDWYRSREDAVKRLLAAVENARSAEPPRTLVANPPEERSEERPAVTAMPVTAIDTSLPVYEKATLPPSPGGELHLQPTAVLKPLVAKVVKTESPVHTDEVIRRIREHWGVGRAGSRIRNAIDLAIRDASKDGALVIKGDFLWTPESRVKPRRRVEDPPPDIALICDEEITEGVLCVLNEQYATPREELVTATARLLGIQRAKRNVSTRIGGVIDSLVTHGGLVARDGRLEPPPP